jgi:predicted MFS family arabinose efflux permease
MPHPTPLPARAWLVVGLLWLVGLLNYLDRVMITTMRGSVVEAIPMTDAQFGLLTSVFLWVYAGLSPFAGFLADRFSRSRVIVISLFAWSVITWLTAHATTFGELLATRALMGVSEACYIPAALALISDYHRTTTRSLAIGVHMTGIMVGSGLGGLGGWIAERHGWAQAFTIFGLVGVGYAVLVLFLLRDAPAEPGPARPAAETGGVRLGAALASLLSRPAFLLALGFWGLLGLAGWAFIGWLPTYLNEQFKLSQGAAGLSATGYLQAASLVGVLLGGFLADRWSRTNPRAPVHITVIGLCLAAPGVLLAATADALPLAIAGVMLYGLTKPFADANMMPILSLVADPRYRATGYGVLNLFSCTVGGLSVYLGGALRDARVDVSRIFLFGALGLVISAVFLGFVRPRPAQAG